MYDHTFSRLANHQVRHQATHKVGCHPGDCIWSLKSFSGVCVGMYGLTCSVYHPRGAKISLFNSEHFSTQLTSDITVLCKRLARQDLLLKRCEQFISLCEQLLVVVADEVSKACRPRVPSSIANTHLL